MSARRSGSRPPRLARLLMHWWLAPGVREYLVGDLDEEYARHVAPRGKLAASWWYWSQAIRSISQGPDRQPEFDPERPGGGVRAWMVSILGDARFALRNLARTPGFTATALVTLALGIGASVAIFSAVNEVMLRPLPFANPDRLVMLWESNEERGWNQVHAAPANIEDWRTRTTSFEDIGFVNDFTSAVSLGGASEPVQVVMSQVSGNAFSVLGVGTHLGRTFREEDTWTEGIAVITYDVWARYLGADSSIVGGTVRLDGRAYEVLGVLNEGFRYPVNDAQVFVTPTWMANRRGTVWFRQAHVVRPVARLADGVTHEQARQDLARVAGQLQREYPDTNRGMEAGLTPLHEYLVGDRGPVLMFLLGAVAVLLLIACTNVANLLLGRALEREQEMAVRAALGARRTRLVRQVLTESLVLAAAGTALGLVLGAVGLRAIAAISPPELGGLVFHTDWRLIALTVTVCVTSALVFGTLPAWRGSRADGYTTLRSSRAGTPSRRRLLAANGFVSFEIGLAVLLVVGAGLMVRSVEQLSRIDPGVDPDNVLTFQLHPPSGTYPNGQARERFSADFLRELAAVPGIMAAGASRGLPLTGYQWTSDFSIEGWAEDEYGTDLRHREATPGYFQALNIPVLDGELFPADLGPEETVPVVVNQAFVDQYFPDQTPVGRRISFDRVPDDGSYWYPIVAVVANERMSLTEEPKPEVISHLRGDTPSTFYFAVKTGADPRAVVPAVRAALARTDAEVPLLGVRTMHEVAADARASERFFMTLLAVFAVTALILAAVGVYGVANQAARARLREVGIRMALGAPSRAIVGRLLVRGAVFAGIGIVVGIWGAMAGSRVLEGMLYQVDPRDPVTLGVVALIMGLVAVGASAWPAWRATRVDPVNVLRAD